MTITVAVRIDGTEVYAREIDQVYRVVFPLTNVLESICKVIENIERAEESTE